MPLRRKAAVQSHGNVDSEAEGQEKADYEYPPHPLRATGPREEYVRTHRETNPPPAPNGSPLNTVVPPSEGPACQEHRQALAHTSLWKGRAERVPPAAAPAALWEPQKRVLTPRHRCNFPRFLNCRCTKDPPQELQEVRSGNSSSRYFSICAACQNKPKYLKP